MSPYEILEIKRGASRERVVEAYRKLAKRYHPDANPDDSDAASNFSRIHDAYQLILKDLDKPSPDSTFFSSDRQKASKRTTKFVYQEVFISIKEAMTGTVRVIGDGSGSCDDCAGEGFHRSRQVHPCDVCEGTGVAGYREKGIIQIKVICDNCEGSGKTTRIRCASCYGFGSSPKNPLNVEIPKGTVDGDTFQVEGGANDPLGNIVGDIEFTVRINQTAEFKTDGLNIECKVMVPVWDAALGSVRTIKAPDGTLFKLKIPAGSSHGTRFSLRGQGIGKETNNEEKGDLIAVLQVDITDASSGIEKEAFERLRDSLQPL